MTGFDAICWLVFTYVPPIRIPWYYLLILTGVIGSAWYEIKCWKRNS